MPVPRIFDLGISRSAFKLEKHCIFFSYFVYNPSEESTQQWLNSRNDELYLQHLLRRKTFILCDAFFDKDKYIKTEFRTSQSAYAVLGVNPYIGKLPAHLKEKYRQELGHEHKIKAYTEGYAKAGTDPVYLPYKVIMIHARKP
ncbi:hypothetical protein CBL_10631 [Carabus blaptoides fortunei]